METLTGMYKEQETGQEIENESITGATGGIHA